MTSELIDHVAGAASLEPKAAKRAVETLLATIVDAAIKADDVVLSGLGKYKVKDVPARQGHNPAAGWTIEIAASRELAFTPGKQIKDALSG